MLAFFAMTVPKTAAAAHPLDEAPFDDEPDDDDRDGGPTEARVQADAGMGVSTTELERRLGVGGWPARWFQRVVGKWIGPLKREQPRRPDRREKW